jgi:hypothetical protein
MFKLSQRSKLFFLCDLTNAFAMDVVIQFFYSFKYFK